MSTIHALYRPSLALLTDLYELTMGCGYVKNGMQDEEAVFNLFFRKLPFEGGYAIACGLDDALEVLGSFRFGEEDLAYLATLRGRDARPLFDDTFLRWLGEMKLELTVDAIPEGSLVFPHEPLLRVRGPIVQCQLVESVLLNVINFQTLVATKAARMCQAAQGEPVIEFGLRRAQGIDGAISASRAAYVGGCVGTSNVLAGKLLGIPVMGTHAHSWVMCFESELEAFEAYARAMPGNCIFLVDTYDSLEGVRNAVRVGQWLREQGQRLVGIRLDSGDLAWLSIQARRLLDEAGFQDTVIVGSNDLDEQIIESLKVQGARIGVWGVGTRLVTGFDDAALGGVYKITAIRRPGGAWEDRIKLGERSIKTSVPGILQVRRYRGEDGVVMADAIYDERLGIEGSCTIIDPNDPTRRKSIPAGTPFEELLVPALREGKRVLSTTPIAAVQERARRELESLHPATRRLVNPHEYPVGLEQRVFDRRMELILSWKRAVQQVAEGENE